MLPRLPFLKRRGAEPGVFSLVSGDSLMRSLTRQHKLPSTVHTRFVSVVDHKHSGRAFGVPHPLRSLYSHDLGRGELARLRKLLRERGPNPLLDHDELGRLAYFRLLGLTHVHGLSNALRMLRHAAWIAARWHDPSFPASFTFFGTPAYWSQQAAQLREQCALMAGR